MNAHPMRLNACSPRLSNILVSTLALAAISAILLVPAQTALALDDDEGLEAIVCCLSGDGDDGSGSDDGAEYEDWDDYATDDDFDPDGFDGEADDPCGNDEDYDVAFFDGDAMDSAIEPSMVICLFDDVSDCPAQEAALVFHRTSAVSHEAGASTAAALPQPAGNASSDCVPASASGFDAVDSPVSGTAVNWSVVQVTGHGATATTATERDNQSEGESDSPIVPLAALGSSALALIGGRRLIA